MQIHHIIQLFHHLLQDLHQHQRVSPYIILLSYSHTYSLIYYILGKPSAVVGLFNDDATAIDELKTNLLDSVTSGSVSVVQLALNNADISDDVAFTSSVLAIYNDYASIVEIIRTKTGTYDYQSFSNDPYINLFINFI